MKIKYGAYENVVSAHDAGIAYGGIVGYTHDINGFGIIQHGIAKDIVSTNKVANILKEMASKKDLPVVKGTFGKTNPVNSNQNPPY